VVRFVVTVIAGMTLWQAGRASAQGRPDCADVLRSFHNPKVIGHNGAQDPNPAKVAHLLGVDADYVERCAAAYGRRVKRRESSATSAAADKVDEEVDAAEKREAEEYDEVSREEKETAGDKYVGVIPDDEKNRKRLGAERNQDDPFTWEPYEHHEWQPTESRPWQPYMRTDDE
jgi:hypothetical protein